MKTNVRILALCLILLLSACGGKADPSSSATIPPDSEKTAPAASSMPSTSPVPSTDSGMPDNRNAEEVLSAWLHESLEKDPDASPWEIVLDLEERGCFRMFSDMKLTEYYPGFDYNMKLPEEIQEAALLYNYSENDRGFVYVFTLRDGSADSVAETLKNSWMDPDGYQTITLRESNRLLLAMLPKDFDIHKVIEGTIAKTARDLVPIFLDYRKENPDAGALEIVEYLNSHQKFTECFTQQVAEGRLTGLTGKNALDGGERLELHGFTDGAILSPMISPNTFICYVFFVKEASAMAGFEETLKNQANLAWNVCVVAHSVITQTDGTAVLFIMCD